MKSRVAEFAQSPVGKKIERALSSVNWDAVLLFVIMFACFMAGAAARDYVTLAKILAEVCR